MNSNQITALAAGCYTNRIDICDACKFFPKVKSIATDTHHDVKIYKVKILLNIFDYGFLDNRLTIFKFFFFTIFLFVLLHTL